MASTKGLYPTLVANAVINALSSPASVVLNIITKPGCFWSGCGLTCPTNVCCKSCDGNRTTQWQQWLSCRIFIVLCFVYWYRRFNCWQILGDSSSSQIPGTCDSQACCCCSKLSLGVKWSNCLARSVLFASNFVSFPRHHYNYLFHNHRNILLQDIRSCETPLKSNPCPSSSTEWRHGECRKGAKICTCYILRLCGIFR